MIIRDEFRNCYKVSMIYHVQDTAYILIRIGENLIAHSLDEVDVVERSLSEKYCVHEVDGHEGRFAVCYGGFTPELIFKAAYDPFEYSHITAALPGEVSDHTS